METITTNDIFTYYIVYIFFMRLEPYTIITVPIAYLWCEDIKVEAVFFAQDSLSSF